MFPKSNLLGPAFFPDGISERKQCKDDEHKALRAREEEQHDIAFRRSEVKRQLESFFHRGAEDKPKRHGGDPVLIPHKHVTE